MNRTLEVFIGADPVGTLFENQGIWSFSYAASWTANGYALAPGLPMSAGLLTDTATARPVQWFFDNLLPEDAARARLFASFPAKTGDAWDLLAHFGAESAGALTLLPPGASQAKAGVQPLTDADLVARILAMPRLALASRAPKKMSLAGAQEKLPVILDAAGALFEPTGASASTHILKPDVLSEHYPGSAVNEWFCARLAHKMHLPVPPVALRYLPAPVYIIQRFDRVMREGRAERLHTLDAAQLLSLAAGAKYSRSGVDALRDVVQHCRAKAHARIALFRWTLFNVMIGNGDAHLKNLSLFAGRDGYALAPHYDLLSTGACSRPELVGQGEAVWPDVDLSFRIGEARTFSELTVNDIFAFAQELEVPPAAVRRELSRMSTGIQAAAEEVINEFAARSDVPAASRAGQMKMLLAILHLPIKTMRKKLAVMA